MARLLDCLIYRLLDCLVYRLLDCPTARLPDRPIARLPDCSLRLARYRRAQGARGERQGGR
eukprot:6148114-Prymnesium_polylepis.1